jgi:hypothetical protein
VFVALTVVPDINCPHEIVVALQTKSFAGAAGAEQVTQVTVEVPQEEAVPQLEFVL